MVTFNIPLNPPSKGDLFREARNAWKSPFEGGFRGMLHATGDDAL
jgi:hypothetical protein